MSQEHDVRTYTLGRPPSTTGLGGQSMKVTVLACSTFFAFIVLLALNLGKLSLAVLFFGAISTVFVFVQVGPRSLAARIQLFFQVRKQRRNGEDLYVSGPDSKVPGGQFRLPGALARTELKESVDSSGNDYALAIDRPNNRATVLLSAQLSGDVDRTREERDMQTSDWGRFEAGLSLSGNVASCVVVISNRPGTGHLAHQEVRSHLDPNAPEIARQIQLEAADLLSETAGEMECHMAVTFKISGDARHDDEFIMNLDYTLPSFINALTWAGIEATPLDYEATVARIRTFYDPATESAFEQMRVEGTPHGLSWENAGPSYAMNLRDSYVHENCTSVTWEMVSAPASTFEDFVLRPLVQPNVNIPRGRLAMIYMPIPASQGTKLVENEYKNALVAMNSSKSVKKMHGTVRAEEADGARRAVARGSQVGLRSLMFTATGGPDDDMRKTRSAVIQAAAQSNIQLQEYKGMHDVGFAMTTGMGQTPRLQNTVSKILK